MKKLNGVFLIPTGIGCEIGGHAGDATPAAKLIASLCDRLIIHPNVVNGSDVNEMSENMLYVEGSILDRFLWGKIDLKESKANKLLVVTNKPVSYITINPVNAARATIGLEAEILELETPLEMIATKDSMGCATGIVKGYKELIAQVNEHGKEHPFDVLAIHTPIEIPRDIELDYYEHTKGRVNPMGGVEAYASKLIADGLNKPVAHAPIDDSTPDDPKMYHAFEHIADPRLAAEFISNYFLQCVLKGLWRAPRIGKGLSYKDIDFMISPYGCVGEPHIACQANNIPIIVVKENKTCLNHPMPKDFIVVNNYLEAAGLIQAMNIGTSLESIRRPLKKAKVFKPIGSANKEEAISPKENINKTG
jgi:hypothetical protein